MKRLIDKKWFRPLVLVFSVITTIIAIIVGSIYGIGSPDNWFKSKEYGNNVEVVATIKADSTKTVVNYDFAKKVANQIDKRINVLGLKSPKIEIEKYNSKGKTHYRIRTTASLPKEKTELQNEIAKNNFEDLITDQPILSIYNTGTPKTDKEAAKNDRPVITNAGYNKEDADIADKKLSFWKPNSAKATLNKGSGKGDYFVTIDLKDSVAEQGPEAFLDMEKGMAGKNLVIWLDHDALEKKVQKQEPEKYKSAGSNLFNFMHVEGVGPDGKPLSPTLKENQYNASHYLLTGMQTPPTKGLPPTSFVISGNLSGERANEIAARINFGLQNYQLTDSSSAFVKSFYGTSSFDKIFIAGMVAVSIIAVIMIINYGLLGVISTISMSLYIFLTILMFTIMRGEYSPTTMGVIILGIGLSIDANITTFERLKGEIYQGFSLSKSIDKSNRLSLQTIVNSGIALIIIAFSLFYFGTRDIKGFSVLLILSIIFTTVAMVLFTRILSTNLIKTGIFKKHKKWIGIYNLKLIPKDYEKPHVPEYEKINFYSKSRWIHIVSGVIIAAAVISFTITAAIAGSMSGGINRSFQFKGGVKYQILLKNNDKITKEESNNLFNYFKLLGVKTDDIEELYSSANHNADNLIGMDVTIDYGVVKNDPSGVTKITNGIKDQFIAHTNKKNIEVSNSEATNVLAVELVQNAMIAITIAALALTIFIIIRFKWTYAVAMLIAFIHDGLIITAVFIVARVQFDDLFIVGLFASLVFSMNNVLYLFSRIRRRMQEKKINEIYDRKILISILNRSIAKSIKKSLISCGAMFICIAVFSSFEGIYSIAFNLTFLTGVILAFFSTPFIAGYIWVGLSTFRYKRKAKRIKNNFWKTKGIEEEVVEGMNDFRI